MYEQDLAQRPLPGHVFQPAAIVSGQRSTGRHGDLSMRHRRFWSEEQAVWPEERADPQPAAAKYATGSVVRLRAAANGWKPGSNTSGMCWMKQTGAHCCLRSLCVSQPAMSTPSEVAAHRSVHRYPEHLSLYDRSASWRSFRAVRFRPWPCCVGPSRSPRPGTKTGVCFDSPVPGCTGRADPGLARQLDLPGNSSIAAPVGPNWVETF